MSESLKRRGVSTIKRNYTTKDGTVHNYEYKKVTISKSCPTFYGYAKKLIKSRTDVKPITKDKLLDVLERYIKPRFEFMPVADVTRDTLKDVLNKCEHRKAEVKQILTTTCSELAWNDYIPKDISQGLKLPQFTDTGTRIERRKKKEMPSWDELQKFCNYTYQNERPLTYIVLFMFCAGTSRSETLGLLKSDFNFKECYATVNKAWVKDKNGKFHMDETKNKYRVRRVYFPKKLTNVLQKGMAHTKGKYFAGDSTGKQPINGDNFGHRYFDYTAKKLEITDVHFNSHIARHVYITNAIDNGVSPTEVMRQVGHRDLRMIMEVYTHYIEQRKPSAKMENYMNDMYNYVTGEQKKEKPTENDNNIITIDFTKRFA